MSVSMFASFSISEDMRDMSARACFDASPSFPASTTVWSTSIASSLAFVRLSADAA